MRNLFRRWANLLLQFIYPDTCFLCHTKLDGDSWVCLSCWSRLIPVEGIVLDGIKEYNAIDEIRAGYYYDEAMQKIIHHLKYENGTSLAGRLGEKLGALISEHRLQADILTSVPLNRTRLRERGYNQAELIGRAVEKLSGIMYDDLIIRKRAIVSQTKMASAEARIENVKEAFELDASKDVCGKTIILIDDLITTGATANACAKTLKEGGAGRVIVLAAARPIWKLENS